MLIKKYFLFASTASVLLGCSNGAKFKEKTSSRNLAASSISNPSDDSKATDTPVTDPIFNFTLVVNKGIAVSPAQMAGVVPGVQDALKTPLSDQELADWKVKIHAQNVITDDASQVSLQFVDLSTNSGLTTVVADFINVKDQKTGVASQVVYVDAEAPKVKLVHLSDAVDGSTSEIVWTATDNYKLDESKLLIIGCTNYVQSLAPRTRAELDTLPANCVAVASGSALVAKPALISLSAVQIAGASILPKDAKFAIYGEDLVGLSSFAWMTTNENGLLSLTTTPSAIIYTKTKAQTINLNLLFVYGSDARQVDQAVNRKIWPDFETKVVSSPIANAIAAADFAPTLAAVLGPTDGAYVYRFQVDERASGLLSNQQTVRYILDTIVPEIDSIQIVIDKQVPSTSSKVSLAWKTSDVNPIAGQGIEVKGFSDSGWTKIADVAAGVQDYTFDWGSRKAESFEIRISATDVAGNIGNGTNKWIKQIFNAAVLTSSVQCYFCHMKIDGDVGGINFPNDAAIRSDTGRNFNISGKLYATNTVPAKLRGFAAGGAIDNYKNTDVKIFPKDNIFPQLAGTILGPLMKGGLQGMASRYDVSNSVLASTTFGSVTTGNYVLDGTLTPISLKGEVYIDGDVIIKGKYRGVGTIYANNIYVVGDLIAVKSPFPFSTDLATALVQAQSSVINGDDGLYLGALNQVVVGTPHNILTDEENQKVLMVNSSPFAVLPEVNYNALGAYPSPILNKDGSAAASIGTQHWMATDVVNAVEVNRVDAYIYSQKVFSWRSYATSLLNGGFMSPKGGIVAGLPNTLWGNANYPNIGTNPRNGLSYTQNAIRYDYRLKIGGGGFETLKTFFDQQ